MEKKAHAQMECFASRLKVFTQHFSSFLVIMENSKVSSSTSEELPSLSTFPRLQYKRSQVLRADEFLIKGKTRDSFQLFSTSPSSAVCYSFISFRLLFPENDYDFMVELPSSSSIATASSSSSITDRMLSILEKQNIKLILTSQNVPSDLKALLLLKDIYYVRDFVFFVICCIYGGFISTVNGCVFVVVFVLIRLNIFLKTT
jgi:hypothetical protein